MYGREWRKKLQDVQHPSTPVSSELLNAEKTKSQEEPTVNIIKDTASKSLKNQAKGYSTKDVRNEKQSVPTTLSKAEQFEKSKEKGNMFVKQVNMTVLIVCSSFPLVFLVFNSS